MITKLIRDEEGQGLIDYVLIIFLVAIGVIAAITIFGQKMGNYYNYVGNGVTLPVGE